MSDLCIVLHFITHLYIIICNFIYYLYLSLHINVCIHTHIFFPKSINIMREEFIIILFTAASKPTRIVTSLTVCDP